MSSRGRAALIGGTVLGIAALVVGLIAFLGPPPRTSAPPVDELAPNARTPADFARLACVHVKVANQSVRADGSAAVVRGEFAAARALAAEAVRRDGKFAALSGGVAALDEAVRRDDGESVGVGLRVVLAECEKLAS